MLAGMSVDYYAKMERGNLAGVSAEVLDALARALHLDDAETDHLHDLARAATPSPSHRRPRPAESTVRPSLQRFLDALTGAPAWIMNAAAAALRTAAGRNPRDKGLTDLIGELVTRSDAFSRRWSTHDVRLHRSGTKHIHHPDVGDLEFVYEAVDLPDNPGWTMFAWTSAAGSPTEERIKLLGSLASTPSDTSASTPEN